MNKWHVEIREVVIPIETKSLKTAQYYISIAAKELMNRIAHTWF